jgi:hypothetical protein
MSLSLGRRVQRFEKALLEMDRLVAEAAGVKERTHSAPPEQQSEPSMSPPPTPRLKHKELSMDDIPSEPSLFDAVDSTTRSDPPLSPPASPRSTIVPLDGGQPSSGRLNLRLINRPTYQPASVSLIRGQRSSKRTPVNPFMLPPPRPIRPVNTSASHTRNNFYTKRASHTKNNFFAKRHSPLTISPPTTVLPAQDTPALNTDVDSKENIHVLPSRPKNPHTQLEPWQIDPDAHWEDARLRLLKGQLAQVSGSKRKAMMKRARIAADLASCLTGIGSENNTVPVMRTSNPVDLQAEASHSSAVDLSEPVLLDGMARSEEGEEGGGRKRRRDSIQGTGNGHGDGEEDGDGGIKRLCV